MYNQPEVALAKYGLTASQIIKVRGAYICDTGLGKKLLVPFRGSEERAGFIREALTYIRAEGMAVEQILQTLEGTVISQDDSEMKYILKDYYSGVECNVRNEADMLEAVRRLAQLHSILKNYRKPIPPYMDNGKNSLAELCERRSRELVKMKNYVRSRRKKNEFEIKFQKVYAHFSESASEAIENLKKLPEGKRLLCHGDFNQHNVIHGENGWQIVNFEGIHVNVQMVDLANFVRKMMEKNGWNRYLGQRMIETYDEEYLLDGMDRKQLYNLLLFPEKFWKIANHYGNSRKSWASARDIEKLDQLLEDEQNRLNFIQNM